MDNRHSLGSLSEQRARLYLERKGYVILATNYRVRQTEIDLIAKDKDTIVFIEVKYRDNLSAGHPFEAVTFHKQRQICRGALFYLNQRRISPDCVKIRFDVVGIVKDEIYHLKNAFDYIGA